MLFSFLNNFLTKHKLPTYYIVAAAFQSIENTGVGSVINFN
jgi:hypothetical protein